MIAAIVTKIRAGSITNVAEFGYAKDLTAPYVVVRPERDPAGRGERVRVIAHMLKGQQTFLRRYVRSELSDLLADAEIVSSSGVANVLESEDDWGGILADNDDGTISMERCFLLPSRLF
jgi:hypothetical protein